ncbi:unnamed protein product [Prunus armeniaca]|uniref:Uncharacterized protein n=1 Tax=Prunus armeniaca TaxID=36596 RepID=A0A6J5UCM8_PRUAR|nr:unnamed protein product [Prunus armeniaca]
MTVPRARSKKNNTLSAERPKRNNPLATDKVAQLRDGTRAMLKLMLARERATTEAIKDQGSSRKYRPKIGKGSRLPLEQNIIKWMNFRVIPVGGHS